MKTTYAILALTATLAFSGAGCSKSTGTSPAPQPLEAHVRTGDTKPLTYNPGTLDIKEITITVGDSIEFRNSDLKAHWPASAPHPTHSTYPEFDPKASVKPGESWAFKFEKAGDWKFHDHLNPQNKAFQGVIHVKAVAAVPAVVAAPVAPTPAPVK